MSVIIPPRMPAPVRWEPSSVNIASDRGAMKAGPIGPGAGPLMTEWLLPIIMPNDEQKKAARALATGTDVPYVRMAERAISSAVGGNKLLPGVGWHLEDPDGETIDEDYKGDPRAVEAFRLMDQPFANLDITSPLRTRRHLWEITSRHMGLAGYGFWYLDNQDDFGIPAAILYIRPDRLLPRCDAAGSLTGWRLDPKPGPESEDSGTTLSTDEIVQYQLQPPDSGYLPTGLIQSAIMKVQLAGLIDKHFAALLSGGGRLSGIISPKTGTIEDDGVFEQMIRDWRNITEQPESAKRVQIVRGPIEFTRTTATTVEMALIDFLKQNEADLLTIWGVPLSQLGGYTPSGLNSGDVRKYDRQAMWENAVIPRLGEITETTQSQILDRYEPLLGGWSPQLVIEIPALEDDSPRYDKLQKAQFIALSNDERRDLIGLDPLDDEDLGGQILMPNTLVPISDLGAVQPAAMGSAIPARAPAPSTSGAGAPSSSPTPPATPGGKAKAKVKAKTSGPDVATAVAAALRKQWTPDQIARVKEGDWKFDSNYPLSKIDYARRPIARNPKIVQGVEAALQVGAPIDPVVLIKTKRIGGSNGKPTEPIDGWHRLLAAEHQGLDGVPAFIGSGDDNWTQALISIDDSLPTPADGPGTKASVRSSIVGLRQTLQSQYTEPIRASVAKALDAIKRDVVSRVRTRYEHLQRKPNDVSAWWDEEHAQTAMEAALKPGLADVADTVEQHLSVAVSRPQGKAVAFGGPAAPGVVAHVLNRGAGRVTKINETTRDGLKELIAGGLDDGMSPAELGDAIEAWSGWDEYRAERIASTELMFAYNSAALETYRDMSVDMVEAIDGEDDPECAERNGQVFSVDDADAIEDHPNGTLDWIPIVDMSSEGE